ncbi:hypothetical protein [Candidatus Blastococcus massiliensis]|uniref:hypothetical protein n=1 Tax=Candidatus Blastococcus massiliensis TaxID=1470358 RepID=UPI0004AD9972|nr:hypothetical protein [Candidatus Blastococcus massiliensis]
MTSDTEARTRDEEGDVPSSVGDGTDERNAPAGQGTEDPGTDEPGTGEKASGEEAGSGRTRGRLTLPLVPVLGVLLVLLLAATAYLWFTRPDDSPVSTADYASALQAARSAVVDIASFDHLTLDDDLEQIRRVTTGDFTEQAVEEFEGQRENITQFELVANTEVIGAGITRADEKEATVMLLVAATSENAVEPRPVIEKSRIQVTLEKVDDRWLLSGISGR